MRSNRYDLFLTVRLTLLRLPWWSISLLAHVCIFMLLTQAQGCFQPVQEPLVANVGIFEGSIAPQPPGRRPGAGDPDDVAMPALETIPKGVTDEAPLEQPTPEPMFGGASAISDVLSLSPPAANLPNLLGWRMGRGGRAEAVRVFGGSGKSERAVDRGLTWLARHQDGNGRWSRRRYTVHCPRGDVCDHGVTKLADVDFDTGITGLALLAFLGRGHIHTEDGPYRDVVSAAVEYLLRGQAANGRYGPITSQHMYSHGIAALAMAEAATLSGDPRLKASVASAVAYIAAAQQPGGGWDYTFAKTGRNDTSVTGWQIMALKSASIAGIDVPHETIYGAIRHFDRQTAATGDVTYTNQGEAAGRRTTSMIAVGLVSRQFLGWHRSSRDLVVQAERLLREPPDWQLMLDGGFHSGYYWYYATLGMFQMGGGYWQKWNARLRDLLVHRQTGFGHREGSWEPVGRWSRMGGRVYFTALNILNLEIYYRYLPLYRVTGGNLGAEALRQAFAQAADANERAAIVRDLGQMRSPVADAAIRKALDDPSMAVRFEAGGILARSGQEAGRQVLAEAAGHTSSFIRSRALEVLADLDEMWVVPVLIRRLADPEPLLARRAADALKRVTGKSFPFDANATSVERAAVVVAWNAWWRDYQAQHPSAQPYRQLGTILKTRAGANAVVFTLRPGVKVEPGQLVWVYRGDTWIATIRVLEVLPQMVAGLVTHTAPAHSLRPNDTVTNRPGGPPPNTTRPDRSPTP